MGNDKTCRQKKGSPLESQATKGLQQVPPTQDQIGRKRSEIEKGRGEERSGGGGSGEADLVPKEGKEKEKDEKKGKGPHD